MNCEGCFFWQAGVVGGDKDKGMCHRYPNWFVTPRDYWCGEFETKERVPTDLPPNVRVVEMYGEQRLPVTPMRMAADGKWEPCDASEAQGHEMLTVSEIKAKQGGRKGKR